MPNVFQQTNKVPEEQPCFCYSEQMAGGSLEEQTEPRSHLNFRNPEHCQPHPLADLKTYNRGPPPLHFQFSKEPMNVEDLASCLIPLVMNVVCCLKLYQICKIVFAVGVMEDLIERDPA